MDKNVCDMERLNAKIGIYHELGFIKGYVGGVDNMKIVIEKVDEIEKLVRILK